MTHALVEENARLRAEAEKLQRERDEADERADFWFGAWAIARAEQAEAVARAVDVLDRDPRALATLAAEVKRLRGEVAHVTAHWDEVAGRYAELRAMGVPMEDMARAEAERDEARAWAEAFASYASNLITVRCEVQP